MALTGTNKGAAGTKASTATTLVFSPLNNCAAGSLVLLALACDNARSGGLSFLVFTVSDNAGGGTNVWPLIRSALYDPAGTNAGVVGGIFARPTTAPALTVTDSITVTWDTAVTAKAWTLTEIVGSFGVPTVVSSNTAGAGVYNAASPPSISIGTVVDANLVLAAAFSENTTSSTSAPWVGDADIISGSWSTIQTIWSGAATTNDVGIGTQYKVVTGTGTQTFNPTIAAGGTPDCVFAWVVVNEVATNRVAVSHAWLELPGPFMASAQAVGSAGLLTPISSVVLTGVAAVGEIENSFFGGAGQAQVAWAELELPVFAGGSVALTQSAAVGDIGDLTPLSGFTGAYVAWAQLTLPPSNDILLTGVAAAGAAGALLALKDVVIVELTGVAALGEAGDLLEFKSVALTQKAAIGRIGELGPVDINYGYIGQLTPMQSVVLTQAAGIGKAGTMDIVGNPDSQAQLGGKAAPGVIGQLTPLQSLTLSGRQALGRAGAVGVAFDYTAALTGVAAVGSAGILSESFDNPAYVFLGGVAGIGAAGALAPSGGVTLTGVAAAGVAGAFDFKGVMLIGVKATGSAGRFVLVGDVWTPKPPAGGIWEPVPGTGEDIWVPA